MPRPVIDRPHPQATFERAPRFLDPLQLLVTQRQIGRTQAVIVAMHHKFAIQLFGGTPFGRVNAHQSPFGQAQVATIAPTGPQLTHPLAVSLTAAFFERRQLGCEFTQDLPAVSPLAFFLLGIVADHVATTALALTHHHFLDPQVVCHLLKTTRALEDVVGDLVTTSHRHTYDVRSSVVTDGVSCLQTNKSIVLVGLVVMVIHFLQAVRKRATLLGAEESMTTTIEFITALFCQVDDQLPGPPNHPGARLWPSEVVTLGLLHALKGGGNRPFYRWLTRDYRPLFPRLPERTRLFRLLKTHQDWTRAFLAAPTVLGVIDTYGIELIPPMREGRSSQQIGRKVLSNHRGIVGGKLCLLLNQWGLIVGWACDTANVADNAFQWLEFIPIKS